MIFIIGFVSIVVLVILAAAACGDFRIFPGQQKRWEEQWKGYSPEELERIGRKYWA